MKLLHKLQGHEAPIFRLIFDPRGDTLVSADDAGVVKFWETQSGKLVRTLEGRRGSISSLAFDPQGSKLAIGTFLQTVELWETRSGKLLSRLDGHQSYVLSLALNPQNGTLASGSNGLDSCARLSSHFAVPRLRLKICSFRQILIVSSSLAT